jgi:DinB family protein
MKFQPIAADLDSSVDKAMPLLARLSEVETSGRPAPGKWSKREILGHLIDSASNNHQRFVRAALDGELVFPSYDQNALVELERFQDADWKVLVELWSNYNKFLAHVMQNLPDKSFQATCAIGSNHPVTLGALCEDYVVHLKHHLAQLVGKEL